MKKAFVLFLALKICNAANTQIKMRIDRIQTNSSCSNTFNFLNNSIVKQTVLQHIAKATNEYWNLELADINEAEIDYKRKPNASVSNQSINSALIKPEFNGWHLSIHLNENEPKHLLQLLGTTNDAFELIPITTSVIDVQLHLKDNNGIVQYKNNAYFIIKSNNNNAFGYPDWKYSLSPTAFTSFFKQVVNLLLDSNKTVLPINIVVGGASFFTDNFIMPTTVNKPRIFTEINKDFAKYTYADSSTTLLRFIEPVIYLMNLKKKSDDSYPQQYAAANKHKKENTNYKYCFAEQGYRNVLTNINYTCKTFVAINDDVFNINQNGFRYLPGNLHCFLAGKDTLATFSIEQNILAPNKEVYLNKIYNGVDSSFQLIQNATIPKLLITYDLQLNGKLKNIPFKILSSANNALKEIYYNDNLVCIAHGINMPEAFILLDNNLPANIFEQLLMMAFFKTP